MQYSVSIAVVQETLAETAEVDFRHQPDHHQYRDVLDVVALHVETFQGVACEHSLLYS